MGQLHTAMRILAKHSTLPHSSYATAHQNTDYSSDIAVPLGHVLDLSVGGADTETSLKVRQYLFF